MFRFIGVVQIGTIASGPNGVEQNNDASAARRWISPEADFGNMISSQFLAEGMTYDRLEAVDISDLTFEKRSSGAHLVHRYVMHNFRDSRSQLPATTTIDHYDDDAFDLHMGPSSGNCSQAGLAKRYNGEGVKISWETQGGDDLSNVDEGEVYQFVETVANDWRLRVKDDGISQYFGTIKKEGTAEAFYRIIGETGGFGNNHEDVNACGDLYQFV